MLPKRVLIFSTAYFPLVGGAEVAVKELTDRLPDYQFFMITARLNRSYPKIEQVGRVKVYRVGFGFSADKFLLPFLGVAQAKKLHKEANFGVIWSIMASYGGFAASRFKAQFPDLTYLLTLQEGDDLTEVERKVFLVRPWFKKIFTRADHIQCISNYLADWAKSFKVKCPVSVVPNGVDLDRFKPALISLDKKLIITTSRLVPKNGVGDLIDSLTFLPRQVTLQIYGQGYLQPALEQKVKNLDLTDRVMFMGQATQEMLPGLIAQASVFCRASLSEGQGISFLEAMAVGLPTVGTRVGGIVDFISNETGWLCEPKNPQNIAKKIAYILDPAHKEEVLLVAKDGQDLIRSNYSWDHLAGKMSQILAGLTNDR